MRSCTRSSSKLATSVSAPLARAHGHQHHLTVCTTCAHTAGVALAFGFTVFSLLYTMPSAKRVAIFVTIVTMTHASAVALALSYLHGRVLFFALPGILLTMSVATIVFMGHAAVESYV